MKGQGKGEREKRRRKRIKTEKKRQRKRRDMAPLSTWTPETTASAERREFIRQQAARSLQTDSNYHQ